MPYSHSKDPSAVPISVISAMGRIRQSESVYVYSILGTFMRPVISIPFPDPLPTPLPQTYTRERPVVRIVDESLRYSYATTYLEFKWQVVSGTPDKLDLMYK